MALKQFWAANIPSSTQIWHPVGLGESEVQPGCFLEGDKVHLYGNEPCSAICVQAVLGGREATRETLGTEGIISNQ